MQVFAESTADQPAYTAPTDTQFALVETLKTFNTNDEPVNSSNDPEYNGDGNQNAIKVYFGNEQHTWWIAGSQADQRLTLFSAGNIGELLPFHTSSDQPVFNGETVTAAHYGASDI